MKTLRTIALLISASLAFALTSCDNWGEKLTFNGGDLYYTENVTKDDADKLGNWLVENEFFDGKEKSVQLDKKEGSYHVRMVVGEEFREDEVYKAQVGVFATLIETSVFKGNNVEIHMCDESFKTLHVIEGAIDPNKAEAPAEMPEVPAPAGE